MCVHVRSMVRRGAADHVHDWLVILLPSLVPSPKKKWPGNKANITWPVGLPPHIKNDLAKKVGMCCFTERLASVPSC